ncbi:hypothetical protein [Microcystis phage vB_MweS-yong2]|nr:hypothetical protein [Microcystis phage vB_MweS-yong2]
MSLATEFVMGFTFTVAGAVCGVWWRLQVQITDARRELDAFKLEAAKNYVSTAALLRLEGRLDEGFKTIRDEMRDQNTLIVNALAARPPARRTKEE